MAKKKPYFIQRENYSYLYRTLFTCYRERGSLKETTFVRKETAIFISIGAIAFFFFCSVTLKVRPDLLVLSKVFLVFKFDLTQRKVFSNRFHGSIILS